MQQKYYWIVGIIVVIGMILIIGCVKKEPTNLGTKSTPPVKIEMSLLQIPKLNDIVDLQLKISTDIDAPTTNVNLILPDGFEYVSGDLEVSGNKFIWTGSLAKDETKNLNVKIKAIEVGEYWKITSDVTVPVEDGQFANADVLFITFDENSGEIFRKMPSIITNATEPGTPSTGEIGTQE